MNVENVSQAYDICLLLDQYEAVSKEVKAHLENFIKNKTLPLDDRWAIWCCSPSNLKNHLDSSYIFLNSEIDCEVGYLGNLYHTEQNQIVELSKVFQSICDLSDEFLEMEGIMNEDIIAEKERILSFNLGSYLAGG